MEPILFIGEKDRGNGLAASLWPQHHFTLSGLVLGPLGAAAEEDANEAPPLLSNNAGFCELLLNAKVVGRGKDRVGRVNVIQ